MIWPESGKSRPAIRRRNVVLPEPDGPSNARHSPSRASILTLSSDGSRPKVFTTLDTVTASWLYVLASLLIRQSDMPYRSDESMLGKKRGRPGKSRGKENNT